MDRRDFDHLPAGALLASWGWVKGLGFRAAFSFTFGSGVGFRGFSGFLLSSLTAHTMGISQIVRIHR